MLKTLALEESGTVISTDADYPLDELAVLRLEVLVFDLPLHSSRCHVQSIHFVVELFFGGVVVGVVPPFDLCQFPKKTHVFLFLTVFADWVVGTQFLLIFLSGVSDVRRKSCFYFGWRRKDLFWLFPGLLQQFLYWFLELLHNKINNPPKKKTLKIILYFSYYFHWTGKKSFIIMLVYLIKSRQGCRVSEG